MIPDTLKSLKTCLNQNGLTSLRERWSVVARNSRGAKGKLRSTGGALAPACVYSSLHPFRVCFARSGTVAMLAWGGEGAASFFLHDGHAFLQIRLSCPFLGAFHLPFVTPFCCLHTRYAYTGLRGAVIGRKWVVAFAAVEHSTYLRGALLNESRLFLEHLDLLVNLLVVDGLPQHTLLSATARGKSSISYCHACPNQVAHFDSQSFLAILQLFEVQRHPSAYKALGDMRKRSQGRGGH